MKKKIMDLLVCPACKGRLDLWAFENAHTPTGVEIQSGVMTCGCSEWYPIINGVPRMLTKELKGTLLEDYRGFFNRFSTSLPSTKDTSLTPDTGEQTLHKRRSIYSFGYEWTEFSGYENENFREWLAGNPPDDFFSGKVGLEAGCGAGRHARTAASLGAEMFAVDLSRAVDVAHKKNIDLPNVHIIQADIYSLPFQKNAFDFVYCLGVIQHLSDPPGGFLTLSSYVKPGGTLFVNVYAKGRVSWPILKTMRLFTTRMPNRLTKSLSFVLTLLDYTVIGPYKIFSHMKPVRPVIEAIVWERTKAYARLDFQANYADWFDRLAAPLDIRYGKEDVLEWYRKAGFEDVIVTPLRNAFWNGAGRKAVKTLRG